MTLFGPQRHGGAVEGNSVQWPPLLCPCSGREGREGGWEGEREGGGLPK